MTPTPLRCLDLFSGIGGFTLAMQMAGGYETVGFCECEPFPCAVLTHRFPGVWIHDDVRTLTAQLVWERAGGLPDIITGGIPCQPASCAGKRGGAKDARWMWAEFIRVVGECHPRWVVAENVPGFLSLDDAEPVFVALEAQGYEVWPVLLGAHHVGAPHRRERIWIVANAIGGAGGRGREEPGREEDRGEVVGGAGKGLGHAERRRIRVSGRASAVGAPGRVQGEACERERFWLDAESTGEGDGLADPARGGLGIDGGASQGPDAGHADQPCAFCGYRFDHDLLGKYGCPNCCGEGLADASGAGCEEFNAAAQPSEAEQGQPVRGDAGPGLRWPARPGEPQYEWEEPRLMAYAKSGGAGRQEQQPQGSGAKRRRRGDTEPVPQQPVGSPTNRLPERLVRFANRCALKAAGNAIVPQVAAPIFRWIRSVTP